MSFCILKLQKCFLRQFVLKIYWSKLLHFDLKWKLLICRCVELRICNFNLHFNTLFQILKLFHLNFSNEYQQWQHFVSEARFSFIEQFIVTLWEDFSKNECVYYPISLIIIVTIVKNNVTSVMVKIHDASYCIPPWVCRFR